MKCDYCKNEAELVGGEEIYPHRHDLYELKFWLCRPCGAYVGTHKGSKKHAPKGRLANAELREWKIKAHAAFDPLWKSGVMSRSRAYKLLQESMGMDKQPHIGFMDVTECRQVINIMSMTLDEFLSEF